MATAIGALNVVVRAGTAEFQTDMQRMAEIAKLKGNDIKSAMMNAADQGSSAFRILANNITAINRPLDLLSTGFNGLGAAMGLGGATAGLTALMASAIGMASSMADLSIKTGVEVEQLSRFSMIAKLSGTDMDTVAQVMKKLSISAVEAYSGNDKLARTFDALGISVKELKAMSPDELMIKVAQGVRGIDPMVLQDLLATVGGRGASQALSFFKELNDRLDETHAKISTQFAADAKDFDDNLTLMSNKLGGVARDITGTFLPAINAMMEAMLKVNGGEGVGGFIKGALNSMAAGIDTYVASATNFQEYAASIARTELQIHDLEQKIASGKGNAYDTMDLNTLKLRLQILGDYKTKVENGIGNKTDAGRTANAQSAIAANQGSSAGDGFLKGLADRVEKAQAGEYAMLRLQAAEKGVLTQAEPIIERLITKEGLKAADQYEKSLNTQTATLEFQNSLIGKSAQEIEVANVAHNNQLALQKQIQQIIQQKGALSEEAETRMTKAMETATERQIELIAQRQQAERTWSGGASKAMSDYVNNAELYGKQAETVFSNGFRNMEDAIVQFSTTGRLNFSNFANGVIADIMRIYARMALIGMAKSIGGMFGSTLPSGWSTDSGTGFPLMPGGENYVPSAYGNVFSNGNLTAFANGGIVSGPTLFPMANGTGLMGEAGPEAVMPLTRDTQGRLGVRSGGSGSTVHVNVVNQAGVDGYQATTTQSKDANGKDIVTVLIEKMKVAMNQDIRNNGQFSQLLASKYGLRGTM